MFFHKVKEVEGLKPVSSQNNSNKYNIYILKLSSILNMLHSCEHD